MRRFLVALLVAILAPLGAVAAPGSAPVLVVFPFTANGASIDKEAPARLATLIATQVSSDGRVAVKAPTPGTERKDFLDASRRLGADYYLSGFITPLGDGVSVVLQLVSTQSGIVVFSNSASLQTYNDAAGMGDTVRDAVLAHAGRNLPIAAPSAPPPQNTPQPAGTNRAETNLGGLFGRKRKAGPAATASAAPPVAAAPTNAPAAALKVVATATPAPPKPAPTVKATAAPATTAGSIGAGSAAIAPVGGAADAPLREVAAARLAADVESVHRGAERGESCTAGVTEVLTGSLAATTDTTFGGHNATFDLVVRDCGGRVVYRRSGAGSAGGSDSQRLAVERAVDAAIGAYLHPNRRR